MIIKNTIYGDKTGLLDPKVKARLDPIHLYSEKNIEHTVTLDNLDFKSMRGGYPEIKTDNLRVAENDILMKNARKSPYFNAGMDRAKLT